MIIGLKDNDMFPVNRIATWKFKGKNEILSVEFVSKNEAIVRASTIPFYIVGRKYQFDNSVNNKFWNDNVVLKND
jgi:hypothetical protein